MSATGFFFSADLRCSSNYTGTYPRAMKWATVPGQLQVFQGESILRGKRKFYHVPFSTKAQLRKGMALKFANNPKFTRKMRRRGSEALVRRQFSCTPALISPTLNGRKRVANGLSPRPISVYENAHGARADSTRAVLPQAPQ